MEPPRVVIDGMQFSSYSDRELNDLLLSIAPHDVDRMEIIIGIANSVIYRNNGNGVLVVHPKTGADEF